MAFSLRGTGTNCLLERAPGVGWMKWISRPMPHNHAPSNDCSKACGRGKSLKPRTVWKNSAVFDGEGTAKLMWFMERKGRGLCGLRGNEAKGVAGFGGGREAKTETATPP